MADDEQDGTTGAPRMDTVSAGSISELFEKLAKLTGGKIAHSIIERLVERGNIDKGELFEEASFRMSRLVNKDRQDHLNPTLYEWITAGDGVLLNVYKGMEGDDDQHIHVLHRDPNNRFQWQFWVLCPFRMMSVPVVIDGDEARARHRANVLIDIGSGKLEVDVLMKPKPDKGGTATGRMETDGAHLSEAPKAEPTGGVILADATES